MMVGWQALQDILNQFEKVNLIPFLQHAKIPFLDCEVTSDTSRSIQWATSLVFSGS